MVHAGRKRNPAMLWWPCGAGATGWKTEKLGEFPLGLLQVEFLRKQILNLEFAFGGLVESHRNNTFVGAREPGNGRRS